MQYVNLGKSDLKVSRIALGLGFRGQSSANDAKRLIEHAIESGINFIDCANKYRLMDGNSDESDEHDSSEEILGQVLASQRDKVVITSKVGAEGGFGFDGGGCSRDNIMQQVECSLGRLCTDHLDVYLLHVFDPLTPLDETLRVMDDLVRSGKVRYVGCANYQAWQVCKSLWLAERMETLAFVCVQNNYSLLNRGLEREMFPLVQDQGLGVMAFSPLAIGLLSGRYVSGDAPPDGSLWSKRREEYDLVFKGDVPAVMKTARTVAAERGRTLAQLAINWILAHEEVTVAISGSDTIEQLDENLGAIGWELSEEEMAKLNERFVELTIW